MYGLGIGVQVNYAEVMQCAFEPGLWDGWNIAFMGTRSKALHY